MAPLGWHSRHISRGLIGPGVGIARAGGRFCVEVPPMATGYATPRLIDGGVRGAIAGIEPLSAGLEPPQGARAA
jgi:hypothetical protein